MRYQQKSLRICGSSRWSFFKILRWNVAFWWRQFLKNNEALEEVLSWLQPGYFVMRSALVAGQAATTTRICDSNSGEIYVRAASTLWHTGAKHVDTDGCKPPLRNLPPVIQQTQLRWVNYTARNFTSRWYYIARTFFADDARCLLYARHPPHSGLPFARRCDFGALSLRSKLDYGEFGYRITFLRQLNAFDSTQ